MVSFMKKNSRKPRYSCFDYAIFLLGRQSYAFETMKEKLVKRGYDEDEVVEATDRLKDLG